MWYDKDVKEIEKNKFLVALDLPLEDLEEMVKGTHVWKNLRAKN